MISDFLERKTFRKQMSCAGVTQGMGPLMQRLNSKCEELLFCKMMDAPTRERT